MSDITVVSIKISIVLWCKYVKKIGKIAEYFVVSASEQRCIRSAHYGIDLRSNDVVSCGHTYKKKSDNKSMRSIVYHQFPGELHIIKA